MKDYRLEIKVKNNVVLKRIEDMGYDSIFVFCREKKLTYSSVLGITRFTAPFYNRNGDISEMVLKLAVALEIMPEEIYPPERRQKPLKDNKYVVEIEKADLMQISTSLRMDALPLDDRKMLNDFSSAIKQVMLTLTPKEQRVLDLRYGLTHGEESTLEEVGNAFNLSRERIRHIEAKAIRKMKHPARSRLLREYLDFIHEVKAR